MSNGQVWRWWQVSPSSIPNDEADTGIPLKNRIKKIPNKDTSQIEVKNPKLKKLQESVALPPKKPKKRSQKKSLTSSSEEPIPKCKQISQAKQLKRVSSVRHVKGLSESAELPLVS